MKIRYYLKKRDKLPTHPVYIALYDGDEAEFIYSGERIKLADWSAKEMQPKDQRSDLFAKIEKVKTQVQKTMKLLEAQDFAVTPFTVKNAYQKGQRQKHETQKLQDKKDKKGVQTVFSLAKAYIEDLPDKFRESTKKTVKISINQFMQYLEKTGQRSLKMTDLNDNIIVAYSKYLLEKRRLADSTHNKRMKHLNWFLKTVNFKTAIVARKLKRKAIIALTLSELRALEGVDVHTHKDKESHEYFQRAKDMFLLGCYTALRISDLKRLNPTNSTEGYITLTTQKNNRIFKMPIVSQAQAILDNYAGFAPKISEQEVNRSIKKVCELAKINKPVEIEYTRGGKSFTKIVPKYEEITLHISGKTFITNAKELWGLEPAEVAGIVGKDLKTMLNHYFKLPVESATIKMINADKAQMKIA